MASFRFDDYLSSLGSGELKSIVRTFGGNSQMRKEECIATIRRTLADSDRLNEIVATLSRSDRNALALLKQMGGAVGYGSLDVALYASGVPLPSAHRSYSAYHADPTHGLIKAGLVMGARGYDMDSPAWHGGGYNFSDARLLAHVGAPEIMPFKLKPAAPPTSTLFRSPPIVALDLIGILQAIQAMGGLHVTQAGPVRANDVRKLAKALHWEPSAMQMDGLTLPDPVEAFAGALEISGLLSSKDDTLVVNVSPDAFAARSYVDQVGALWRGFVGVHEWFETDLPVWSSRYSTTGRWVLSIALAALPAEGDSFFRIDDLSLALYERIGEHFSLDYPPQLPYHFNETPDQAREADAKWRAKLRADWAKEETPWIRHALASWMYFLGLVELGMENGKPVAVRLTDLGCALFHPELKAALKPATRAGSAAWVVQPNFDIVVYLDRAAPKQLAFLERTAERVNAQQHTAQYRLTRESVYRGLESRLSLDDLLAGLKTGSDHPLPANVVTELAEWSTLREKMTIHRRARLLEFSDAGARAAAQRSGIGGTPVGDRFLLLAGKIDPRAWETVNYAKPLSRCLAVTEQGVLRMQEPARDFLLLAQLARWTEARPDGTWQLTASSIAAALRSGARLDELMQWLPQRLTTAIPPILDIALRAWAGEPAHAELATVTVLHCPRPDVFAALATSEVFKPYLLGRIAPDVLLVDPAQIAALQAQLAWMGLRISSDLIVTP